MKLNTFFTNTIQFFINNIIYFYKKDKVKVINNESSFNEEELISDTQKSIIPLTNAEYFERLTETDDFFLSSLTQSLSDSQDILNAGYIPSLKVKKIINNLLLVDFSHNILKLPEYCINTLNSNSLSDTLVSDKHDINKSITLINFLGDNKLLLPDLISHIDNKYSFLNISLKNTLTNTYQNFNVINPYNEFTEKFLATDFSSVFLEVSDFFPKDKPIKQTETPELSLTSQAFINNLIIKEQEQIKDGLYFDEISKTYKPKNKNSYKEKTQALNEQFDESIEFLYNTNKILSKILEISSSGIQNDKEIVLNSIRKNDEISYSSENNLKYSPLFVNTIIDKIIESKAMIPKEIFLQKYNTNKELTAYILLKYKEELSSVLKIEHITTLINHFEKSLKKEDNIAFFDFLSSTHQELKSDLKDNIIKTLNSNNYNKAIEDFNLIKIGDILNLPFDFKEKLSNIQNKINELDNISLNIEQNRFLDSLKKETISNIDNYTSIKAIDPNIDINSLIQSISDLEISLMTFQKNIIDEQLKLLQTNKSSLKVKFK